MSTNLNWIEYCVAVYNGIGRDRKCTVSIQAVKLLRFVCNFCMNVHVSRARDPNSESMCYNTPKKLGNSVAEEYLMQW